jgi:hypothetical protein
MCRTDQENVTVVEVAPATWNGFNNFAEVCDTCHESRKFKTSARPKKPGTRVTKASAAAAVVAAAAAAEKALTDPPPAPGTTVQITHRRTGVVLHTVLSPTLAHAPLSGAVLSGADLQNATLRGADLLRADLRLADLAGADLRGADLRGVNFRGADLRGTDLREARLAQADFSHVLYDAQTRWPQGYGPTAARQRTGLRAG